MELERRDGNKSARIFARQRGGWGGVIWAWWNGLRISGIYVGSDFFRVVLEGVSLHASVTQHPLEDVGL
jgi:hypothetical protein